MADNLELKARIASLPGARTRAHALPAPCTGILHQTDTYFHVPHGRCKLREFGDGTAELVAYTRPEQGSERWSHYIAAPVSHPSQMKEALRLVLGDRVVVRKVRELFLFESARIHLDLVEGLGEFIEFEVTGGEEAARRSLMKRLRDHFEVEERDCLACSYADLILAKAGQL